MLAGGLNQFCGKRVLMLQGPLGPFFGNLMTDLQAIGAQVFKVNFNAGDWLYSPSGLNYRGNEVLGAQVAKKTRITLCFVGLLAAMAEMGTAPNALAGPKSYDINVLLEEPHPFAAAPNTSAPAYIPADQIRPRARVPQQVPYRQPTVRTAAERSARDRMFDSVSPAMAQLRNNLSNWGEDIKAAKWESGITLAVITATGLTSWNWGSSNSFNFNPEGWFGEDTGSGGADKLGHAFTSYALTNVVADRLIREGRSPERAALSAALTAQALMLYVEVFDGFSDDHGFAREDVVVNLLGTGLAYARTVNPRLRDTLDFRMEYQSSGYKGFRPSSDYSGQKFLLALKLSGFDAFKNTPLRYLELQTGYYTRGFSKLERDDGFERSRHRFVGIGVNLNELFFGRRIEREPELKNLSRLFLEHIQIPHTATRSSNAF